MLALGTLATFAFYQWTQRCVSGLIFFLSASIFALVLLTLAGTSFFLLRISRTPDGSFKLFSKDYTYIDRWGSLYDTMSERRIPFVIATWSIVIIRSAIVGFGQHNGLAQVIVLIVVDLIFCAGEHYPLNCRYNALSNILPSSLPIPTVLLAWIQQGQLLHPNHQASLERAPFGLCRRDTC
jgi:Transient receptor potential (TRP) ion channel